MKFVRAFLAALVLLAASPATADVAANATSAVSRTAHVTSRLVAERNVVGRGQSLRLVLDQSLLKGWHTYWLNPGDTGLATRINWILPAGWRAGPIQWPTPVKIMLGPLVNHGYEDNVKLLSSLRVPADAEIGSKVTIAAQVSWLVCEQLCIPERANLSLDVTVGEKSGAVDPKTAAIFRQAQAAIPRPGASVLLVEEGGKSWLQWPATGKLRNVSFFAEDKDVLAPNVSQTFSVVDGQNRLDFGAAPKVAGGLLKGILSVNGEGLAVAAKPQAAPDARVQDLAEAPDTGGNVENGSASVAPPSPEQSAGATSAGAPPRSSPSAAASSDNKLKDRLSLWKAILFAVLGGAILNFMPCVFPVLSIKAMALARHGRHQARLHGLTYGAGVISCFMLIAIILLTLRMGGQQLGWGFQLQSPLVVTLLAYVMLLLGLSMSGVFMIGTSVMGVGSHLTERKGLLGSFFTGVLATVVAAPCTAPFMGAAVGYALLQPSWVSLVVFVALGAGMALPFVALTFFDPLLRKMPRPGPWMERLKQLFAFPLYATAGWLLWVCTVQTGPAGLAVALSGAVLLALAAYLYGQDFRGRAQWVGRSIAVAAAAGAIALPVLSPGLSERRRPASTVAEGEPVMFSRQGVTAQLANGRPVLVDFTAAWCITCLANERIALSRPSVREAMARKNVVFMKADWTNQDAHITQALNEFGRSGVPLYLLYEPGKDAPLILPQILTESIVLDALKSLGGGMPD